MLLAVTVRQGLKRIDQELTRINYWRRRKFGRVDRDLAANYLRRNGTRKLHIGCGSNILESWLNLDYRPSSSDILHLDATEPFPIEDDEFDFIFSEHMIEHVSHPKASQMLAECFRVLKPNGTIRISTPDLLFLINLYGQKSDLQNNYIKWATTNFIHDAPYDDTVFVINNFVRDWGHLFIYDEKTLRFSLERAGFTGITKCELNQSLHEALRNLENEGRMPNGFLKLETFTLEGTKFA